MRGIRKWMALALCCCLLTATASLFAQPVAAYENTPTYKLINKGVSLGWEGDYNAIRTYVDGNFILRDDQGDSYNIKESVVTLGLSSYGVPAHWYLAEHYLPCSITEYTQQKFDVKVETFCDCVTIDGNDFVVVYIRQTLTNHDEERLLPQPDSMMLPLNEETAASLETGAVIGAGETVVRELGLAFDRFANEYEMPTAEQVVAQGGFDAHYAHMKAFWEERVSHLVQITDVPEGYEDLLYVYKTNYIYQMIAKDNYDLNVNESCYDDVYNHDVISILDNIIQLGDFKYFKEYADHLYYDIAGYSDGPYKTAFPYAYYLMKTGDTETVAADFERLTQKLGSILKVPADMGLTNPDGSPVLVCGQSISIDKRGIWLLDSESALAGLYAYKYVCDTLYAVSPEEIYKTQADWAVATYNQLLMSVETCIRTLVDQYGITYLPMSMYAINPLSNRGSTRDANTLAIFQFGFWSWDGFLMNIPQENSLLYQMIDGTYTYHFAMRDAMYQSPRDYAPSMYSAGGFSTPSFCASFNAGYGSGTLRGSLYRDWTIRASMWMIDYAQMAPYTWAESSAWPDTDPDNYDSYAWADPKSFVTSTTGGDDGHLWGQSLMSQMIVASFIAEQSDGRVVLGLGLPYSWFTEGETMAVSNYPYGKGNRMGYTLSVTGEKTVQLEIEASAPVACSLELPAMMHNIASATDAAGTALSFDYEAGTVAIPAGTVSVTVTLENTAAVKEEARDLLVQLEQKLITYQDVTAADYTATSYHALTEAMTAARAVADLSTAAGSAQLTEVLSALEAAKAGLQLLAGGAVMDASVLTYDDYWMCNPDSMTYQTFTTGEEAGKVAFVDIWGELKMNNSYTFEGLKGAIYSLNGSKYYPYKLGEELGSCVLELGAGTPYRYHFTFDNIVLEPNTQYALVLTTDMDLSEYDEENFDDYSKFVWELGPAVAGEYFIDRAANGKMYEKNSEGNGSYRIVFGDGESKAALDQAASAVIAKDLTLYTEASVKPVNDALAAIDVLLRMDGYTAEEQTAAINALNAAVEALAEKAPATAEVTTGNPTTSGVTDPSSDAGIPVWGWIVIGAVAAAAVVAVAVICIVRGKKQK